MKNAMRIFFLLAITFCCCSCFESSSDSPEKLAESLALEKLRVEDITPTKVLVVKYDLNAAKEVLPKLKRLADNGNAEANAILAGLFLEGTYEDDFTIVVNAPVAFDAKTVEKYARRALDIAEGKGDKKLQGKMLYLLGRLALFGSPMKDYYFYITAENFEKALPLLDRAEECRNSDAERFLSSLYRYYLTDPRFAAFKKSRFCQRKIAEGDKGDIAPIVVMGEEEFRRRAKIRAEFADYFSKLPKSPKNDDIAEFLNPNSSGLNADFEKIKNLAENGEFLALRRFSGFPKFGWLVKKYGLPIPAQPYVGCSRYNFEMYRKTGRHIFLAALFGNPTGFTDDEIEFLYKNEKAGMFDSAYFERKIFRGEFNEAISVLKKYYWQVEPLKSAANALLAYIYSDFPNMLDDPKKSAEYLKNVDPKFLSRVAFIHDATNAETSLKSAQLNLFIALSGGNSAGLSKSELKILPDELLKKVLPRAGGVLRKQIEARLENK